MKIYKYKNFLIALIIAFSFNINVLNASEIFVPFNFYQKPKQYTLNKKDELLLNLIKDKVKRQQFSDALRIIASFENKTFSEVIENFILSESFKSVNILDYDSFKYLIIFNDKNNFLPTFKEFNKKIERYYINNNVEYTDVNVYFNKYNSENYKVNKKLLKQKLDYIYTTYKDDKLRIKREEYKNEVKIFLKNFKFQDRESIVDFINNYSIFLSDEDIIEKVNILLFQKSKKIALALIPFIKNNKYVVLFKSVLKIEQAPKYINNILRAIPKELREEEILLYTKLQYYRKMHVDNKEIFKIFFILKGNSKYPQYWYKYRSIYAREMIKEKEYKKAYYLIATHNMKEKQENYSDAEWLSGWIALSFLEKPTVAIEHFTNFYKNVSYPISKSRGIYWLGRSYEKNNETRKAIKILKEAMNFQLQFYGQMSLIELEKISKTKNYSFDLKKSIKDQFIDIDYEDSKFMDNLELKTAYFYNVYLNEELKSADLFKSLIRKTKNKADLSIALKIISSFENPTLLFDMSKIISYNNVYKLDYLYPKLNLKYSRDEINYPLIHAIIRQESAFKVSAKSTAGAKGFMQIMPATAKNLTKQLNMVYNKKRLLNDYNYNIFLGHYYIQSLISQFNGSVVLAIASYNAGPNNAKRWLRESIDITKDKHKSLYSIVNWMEYITYYETRNYVQRVMENLVVYENIFNN